MRWRWAALATLLGTLVAFPTRAEEELGVWLSRRDAARAFGEAARVPALEGQVRALEAEAAELRAGRDAALKLVEITEQLVAGQERLRQLAEKERDAHKARAERIQQDADAVASKIRWAKIQAWGATGAAFGTLLAPMTGGLSIIGGAVVGGIVGALAP